MKSATENRKSDTRLAFVLVAPAAVLMLAVTAYPIGYAIWLSLQRNNLTTPNNTRFIGLGNYQTILTDRYWWTALAVTLAITVASVSIEFVLGLALALAMHRTLVGKGLVRTAVLIPYGIVTVAASYSWYYAWTPGTGYLANLLPHGSAPLTHQLSSLGVVVIAEVWKTTPFMSLLLLAGIGVGAGRPAEGRRGRRRRRLAAAVDDHVATDQTGDPGGAAVPHAGCVPDLRQHLRAHRRHRQHRLGVDPWLRQFVQGLQCWPGVGDFGADLRMRRP